MVKKGTWHRAVFSATMAALLRRYLAATGSTTRQLYFVLVVIAAATSCDKKSNQKDTDFTTELNQIDKDIAHFKDALTANPIEVDVATRFVYRLYHRASLTGTAADFSVAESAVDHAIRRIGPSEDLSILKANLDFKLHRFVDVQRDLDASPGLLERPIGRALKADLDFQYGRYETARKGYEGAIENDRTWDNLTRLAYFDSKMGKPARADQLYCEAEDEITAKEMRSYAWVELQRGLLALGRGNYENALSHYTEAEKAYSGYWLTDEYVAELFGAQGKFDQAVSRYMRVIARAPRPDVEQALGDLYLFMGKPDLAKPWHEKALAGYLTSVRSGEVQYLHHLAGFYSDVLENGAEAVKWASKDVELRHNFAAYDSLAWAFYRAARFTEAVETINVALSSKMSDAHIFFHAAMIYVSVGRTNEARQLLTNASEVNPHYDAFHVHR